MTRHAPLVILLLVMTQAGTHAASLAGVDVPDTVTVDGATLHLNGVGLRQAYRVKAYVGALYLEQRSHHADTVIASRQRKHVLLIFLRDIGRDRLASGWTDSLREVREAPSDESIERFAALIGDVKKGDTMSFTSRPDAGVEVALRGGTRGTVPGDAFSRALFTVWFGPKPGDANLKRGMLGD